MEKKIIIIGAGIAGLAAGCYAQMNGYQSEIFELHNLPGGMCTAWERNGYTFDGCIHYLFGTGSGQPFHRVWEELGAAQSWQVYNHTELLRVNDPSGRSLIVYADPDQLEQHMLSLSAGADAPLIRELCNGIRLFTRFDMSLLQNKPRNLWNAYDWRDFGTRMTPFIPALGKWALVSAQDFANRFKDPFLRRAVPQMFSWPEIPMMAGLSLLAYMHTQNAGFPVGGSLGFARQIEKRYLELGGKIHYKSQVEKILTQGNRVTAVRLYNDEIHPADIVISACDGRGTLFYMLGERFVPRSVKKLYNGKLPMHAMIQVSLGVNRDFSSDPHWVVDLLDQPILLAGEEHHDVSVKNYAFDVSLAPEGKSSLVMMIRSNYEYWHRIYGHRLYDTEQDQVARSIQDFLEARYPGLQAQTEIVDVSTPLSYERYTGNWQGASCGWLLTKQTMPMMIKSMQKKLPALENFYMAGQWVEPGGSVPIVAMSGRNAVQLICADEGRPFTTALP